ncbi:hypothetical protein OH720_23615 [Pseudomonas sp. WJP1]|uniref:hypothetical protein n=1 Tax=Pseudomonas sp. WJP1 TaxID=2986947 RepID=UPI00234AF00C|nr:hypothetical protein [Pseudomonas sp. WJP1]WCM49943.1 hypothetical protein OH720_23615 [Pseudomonas sp. WJP1]
MDNFFTSGIPPAPVTLTATLAPAAPTVLDALRLPETLHSAALMLLEIIESAETRSALDQALHRAEGFLYGITTVSALYAVEAADLEKIYRRTRDSRLVAVTP